MNETDHKRKIAPNHFGVANRLRAALIAEFATLIKSSVNGEPLICQKDGKTVLGVAVPFISWTVLEGDAQSALEIIQSQGIEACADRKQASLYSPQSMSIQLDRAIN